MESTNNNNNNQLFICEFKELRKELSSMKKRIVQLEESHEKQQERLDILERENRALKKKTQLNIDGNKAGESTLKRKRTEKDHEKMESNYTSALASTCKKETKTNNNDDNDDEEAVMISRYDNGDSFDSLSDDLLHKIVEFDGKCYSKFGLINKRCKNIYDVEEYKLKKQTCVYGYGTVDMMLEYYLQKRKKDELCLEIRMRIIEPVIIYNRLDAMDWVVQLGDSELVIELCCCAAEYGRIDLLKRVFCKCNLTMLDELLNNTELCYSAVYYGYPKILIWLRKYGAKLDAHTFIAAKRSGCDQIVQYLRLEGCPEQHEERDDSPIGSDDEDSDY